MNKTNRSVLAVLCLLSSVLGASAETLKLKLEQILPLANALASLDQGQTKIIKQGDAPDKVLQLPYEFSGATRWAIARNLGALKREVEAFEKTRADLIKQISGGGAEIKKDEPEKFAKYLAEITPIVESTLKLELQRLKPDDLKLDQNPIPASTLVALEPILTPGS